MKVGGVPSGSVDSIELGHDGRARVKLSIDDASVTPLHSGSRAEVGPRRCRVSRIATWRSRRGR